MKLIHHYDKNEHGRDFVVGDIHGDFSMLEIKLSEYSFDKSIDRLFSCGDLIDRGPESEKALEYLAEPWFHAVMGNHEIMLCEWHSQHDPEPNAWKWRGSPREIKINGSAWGEGVDLEPFYDAFMKLPVAIEVDTDKGLAGIAHGDPREVSRSWTTLRDRLTIIPNTLEDRSGRMDVCSMLWGRDTRQRFRSMTYWVDESMHEHVDDRDKLSKADHEKWFTMADVHAVYLGHTPYLGGVLHLGNLNYIDQGAPWFSRDGAELTMVQIQ